MQAQLPKVDWLHLSTVTFTKAASSDAYDKLITDAQVPYTLIVRLDYHLSWDLKLLLVTATAQLLPKPTPGSNVHQGPNGTTFTVSASDPSNIIYTNTVTYVASIPDGMLSEHASFKEAAPVAMPYWSKDHAAVTRAALADAAAEVSRLVALSLQNPGKTADVKDEVAVGPEEGHILEKAFGQYVVGMVMGIDEAGNDELAPRFDHPRFIRDRGAAHDFLLEFAVLVRRCHRDDSRAPDKDVAHRGIVDVSIMIIDTAAAYQNLPV